MLSFGPFSGLNSGIAGENNYFSTRLLGHGEQGSTRRVNKDHAFLSSTSCSPSD